MDELMCYLFIYASFMYVLWKPNRWIDVVPVCILLVCSYHFNVRTICGMVHRTVPIRKTVVVLYLIIILGGEYSVLGSKLHVKLILMGLTKTSIFTLRHGLSWFFLCFLISAGSLGTGWSQTLWTVFPSPWYSLTDATTTYPSPGQATRMSHVLPSSLLVIII